MANYSRFTRTFTVFLYIYHTYITIKFKLISIFPIDQIYREMYSSCKSWRFNCHAPGAPKYLAADQIGAISCKMRRARFASRHASYSGHDVAPEACNFSRADRSIDSPGTYESSVRILEQFYSGWKKDATAGGGKRESGGRKKKNTERGSHDGYARVSPFLLHSSSGNFA